MITSNASDNVQSIYEKIQSQNELKDKMGVYLMFSVTHSHLINALNIYIQNMDDDLWKEIQKATKKPSIWAKAKGFFK